MNNSPDSQHCQDGLDGLDGGLEGATSLVLEEARRRYENPDITETDLWHYIYGTFHAPDWRERFSYELENYAPRFPWVSPQHFSAFRDAGAKLMTLHADYDQAPEHPEPRLIIDEGSDALIQPEGMSWAKAADGSKDLTRLQINPGAVLVDIPVQAHDYKVAGHSPLQWAVNMSCAGEEPDEDPNIEWDDPDDLVAHLRRLVYVSVRTVEIRESLPPSLTEYEEK